MAQNLNLIYSLHLPYCQRAKQNAYKLYWYSNYKKVFEGNSVKLEKHQINSLGKISL
jgi:hypothetical protein